jgi:nucleoside-diphosphate kinase
MVEQTLMIVKPDAVRARRTGEILRRIEEAGFSIREMKMVRLTEEAARRFYDVHREKPFYLPLVEFMTSGPCVPVLIERENAILGLREFIGKTNPKEAAPGTIRSDFGTNVQYNAVHASDGPDTAKREKAFFFDSPAAD